MDFTITCRACMKDNEESLNSLFVENLADIFMTCTELRISEHDKLPQNICTSCAIHLQALYKFKMQCQMSETSFISYLTKNCSTSLLSIPSTKSEINSEPEIEQQDDTNDSDFNNDESNSIEESDFKSNITSKKRRKNKDIQKAIVGECPICNKQFTYLTSFEKHKSICGLDDKSPMLCGLCDFRCDTYEKLNSHLETHVDAENLSCVKCDYTGIDWADLFCHRYAHQTKNSDTRLRCWKCDRMFFNIERLEFHIRLEHLNKPPGLCKICFKEFRNIKNLRAHKLMHEGVKPNKCNVCDKRFLYKRSLILHMRCHSDVKKYVCHICGMMFKFRTGLTSHQFRMHSDVPSMVCNHCGKTFKNKKTLRVHLLRVESVKNFKCTDCGKMYRNQRELDIHSKWHSDAKPYQCNYCSKSYKCSYHLTSHLRQHTGERPYQCDVCKNSFTTSSTLKKHTLIHTNEKRHTCKLCGKSFIEKSNLKSHQNTHKHRDNVT